MCVCVCVCVVCVYRHSAGCIIAWILFLWRASRQRNGFLSKLVAKLRTECRATLNLAAPPWRDDRRDRWWHGFPLTRCAKTLLLVPARCVELPLGNTTVLGLPRMAKISTKFLPDVEEVLRYSVAREQSLI